MWKREQARAVGERVKRARAVAHISQRELETQLRILGVRYRQTEISRLERGMAGEPEYTRVSLLAAIASVTNVDVRWLTAGTLSFEIDAAPVCS